MQKYLTKSDLVYEHLKTKVISGALSPGARVTTDSISKELDVSGIPVREGMQRLEADGFLRRLPHKGSMVRTFEQNEVQEIFAMLGELEPMLLGRINPDLLPASATELVTDASNPTATVTPAGAAGPAGTQLAAAPSERTFFSRLYATQDFSKVTELITELLNLLELCRTMYDRSARIPPTSLTKLNSIFDLLRAGKLAQATTVLAKHRAQQRALFLKVLSEVTEN